MLELQLSNITPGDPSSSTWKLAAFLDTMHDRLHTEAGVRQTLFFRGDNLAGETFHRNYLQYLELCWARHYGIVVSPDILWYTLLTELTSLIAEHPEGFRELFTRSEETTTLLVPSESPSVLPLDTLIHMLKEHVPSNVDTFLPSFSTTTDRSRHAMYAAFCDAVSPYYNYMVFCCGFPAIRILGESADWELLQKSWAEVTTILAQAGTTLPLTWFQKVGTVLGSCVDRRQDADWWREMFRNETCGSGSQQEVFGWYSDLFRIQPQGVRKSCNFSSGVTVVNYTSLVTNKSYCMKDGLFLSQAADSFLVPDFGSCLFEKRDIGIEPVHGYQDRAAAIQRLLARAGENV